MSKIWMVYLLWCRDGSLYAGITTDLDRRLAAHNAGTASRYTRSRLPVVVVHSETHSSHSLALKREAAVKRLTRQQKLDLVAAGRIPQLSAEKLSAGGTRARGAAG
ncbi:MAG: GIY-YIG nuclease family protein [Planctomycetota bacterium]|nr:MAG: GIY-YIG nuclease family protein [Planctomycetota bacterium]